MSEHPPSPADVVKRVRAGFGSGRTRPVTWRREQLHRVIAALREREDELLAALRTDFRKPGFEGYLTEVAVTRLEAEHALAHLDAWMRPTKVSVPLSQRPAKARIVPEPLGVVLIIGPWNYPLQLILSPLVAAIAAGNAAVLKPSELAPATSAALSRLVRDHLDPECVAVVEGAVPETTALLAERWDHILYTGNGAVGRVVMEAAAKHLTPVTLELGGKSPAIVDRDADVAVAARRIAWGKFVNAGQTCVAPDYVLAHRDIERQLVDALAASVRAFYGADPRASADFARIVNDRHFTRLEALLDSGTPAIGGETDATNRYIAPTVLVDVDPDAPVMREEIFGPILPVIPVASVDDGIAFVNERDKPLALYVFSEDDSVVDHVVRSTSSGGVTVNATLLHVAVPELPFGGVGASGTGAYHGKAGFDTFTHHKSVLDRTTSLDVPVTYPPYSRWKQKLLRRLV